MYGEWRDGSRPLFERGLPIRQVVGIFREIVPSFFTSRGSFMKVLRSSLLVAATAIVAAACGDKVNVEGPPSSTASITSVQVAPSSATISVNQTVTLTAAVNASAGLTTTVAWSTSSAAAATVTQAGAVTGVTASPGVAICATASATGVASVENCATVVVQAASVVSPASVQIASVTGAAGLNVPAPVPPAAVAGQINVSVNVNPGTEKIDSVVVMMNGKSAGTQSFSDAQAAALRSAANTAIAAQALLPTIVFSINTAAYSTTTGAVTYTNGPLALSAVAYGHQTGAATTNSASQSLNYLLGNADAWIVAQTYGAGTNTAANANGFQYMGGPTASVSVTAIPVLYSGLTIASANVNYGTLACDANVAVGAPATNPVLQRVQALTAPVAPSAAWTATFSRTAGAAAAANNVNNYEFNAVACAAANAAGGEGAAIANSLYTTNATGPIAFANASPAPVVRLDNRAPGQGAAAPTLLINVNGRLNSWINAAVSLTTKNGASTPNGEAVAGTADAGVGGYVYNVRVGAPGAGGIVDPVLALTPTTTFTTPAPSLANTSYCAIVSAKDLVGNESLLPAAGTVCTAPPAAAATAVAGTNVVGAVFADPTVMFGVDIAPPTIAFSGGMAAGSSGTNGLTGANVAGVFQVAVLDTGVIGNSGMNATAPVSGTVTVHSAAVGLTAAQTCPVGVLVPAVTGVCTAGGGAAAGFAAPVFPLVATGATLSASTIIGYYTYTAVAVDAAGNASASVTRTVAYNPAANVPTVSGSIFNSPLNGPTATFTATGASGNTTANSATTFFDLWEVKYNLTYSAGLAGPLLYPPTVFNTFNNTTLLNTNVPVAVTVPFVRQIQNQSSACNAALTVAATGIPNQLQEVLVDQVANASAAANTPIIAAQVTPGVSVLAAAAPQLIYTDIVGNGVTEQPTGGCPLAAQVNAVAKVSGGGTSPDAASITLKNDVWGPTATFAVPFAQVNFYVLVGGNLEQIGTTSTYTATDDGSANGHKYSFTFAWTPGTKSPVSGTAWAAQSSAACAVPTAISIYALGISAAGDGLLTPVTNNVCITTAP
jgi:hypothetical protein